MNTFTYVYSNPLYWIDPLGLSGNTKGHAGATKSNFAGNFSGSFGGYGHLLLFGLGGDIGIAGDTNGKICIFAQVDGGFGMGLYGGYGFTGSAATGPLSSGFTKEAGVFGVAGAGPSGGGSANTSTNFDNSSSSFGAGKAFGGIGVGGAGGIKIGVKGMYCFNEDEDNKGCNK